MPTYLVHGFRWNRASIRIHIILQDLEDAAAEWIVAPATSITILNSFYTLYDFLPPSHPPAPNYPPPPPIPQDPPFFTSHVNGDNKRNGEEAGPQDAPKPALAKPKGLRKIGSAALLRVNGHKSTRDLTRPKTGDNKLHKERNYERPKTSGGDSVSTSQGTLKSAMSMGNIPPVPKLVPRKPVAFNDWSAVKLLEQYDPDDLTVVSQPYAYVADHMIEVKLAASMTEEIKKYEAKLKADDPSAYTNGGSTPGTPGTMNSESKGELPNNPSMSPRQQKRRSRRLGWLEKLRDGLEKDSEVGWFIVVCGDEERAIENLTSPSQLSLSLSDPERPVTRGGLRGMFQRSAAKKKSVRDDNY